MIETCTTKRMLILIGFLLVSSCLILLFEEYVEENEFDTSRIIEKVASLNHKHSSSIPKDTQTASAAVPTFVDCNSPGALKLINTCVQCSDFEINALKTPHCQQTGYYDKYLCAATNQSVYLPCHSKTISTTSKFNYFTIFTFISSVGFSSFVFWRRSIIERKAYTRLQNFIG